MNQVRNRFCITGNAGQILQYCHDSHGGYDGLGVQFEETIKVFQNFDGEI
jgi:hypothetical protein